MLWLIPGTWKIVEGSIDLTNSRIAIAVDTISDSLQFPDTTDESGLRILAQIECDRRTNSDLTNS